MELPEHMTIGEAYGPAMEITTQTEADEYFAALVHRNMRFSAQSRREAEGVVRQNLGYYAGYYTHETRQRVERLFRCSHPVFGAAESEPISADEAFAAGKAYAKSGGAQ